MKKIDACPCLKNNLTTLRETSKDTSSGTPEYMTESLLMVVNFDAAKRKYLNDLGASEKWAKSVDAILMSDGGAIFIEFKNGEVKSSDIKRKIKDSLLMFCDVTDSNLKEAREKFSFILVYSTEKNNCIDYRTSLAIHRASIGKHEFDAFGLKDMEKICFNNVKAVLPKTLEKTIKQLLSV